MLFYVNMFTGCFVIFLIKTIYSYYYLHSYNNEYATQLHYSRTEQSYYVYCQKAPEDNKSVSSQIMLQNVVDKVCLIIYFSVSLLLFVSHGRTIY